MVAPLLDAGGVLVDDVDDAGGGKLRDDGGDVAGVVRQTRLDLLLHRWGDARGNGGHEVLHLLQGQGAVLERLDERLHLLVQSGVEVGVFREAVAGHDTLKSLQARLEDLHKTHLNRYMDGWMDGLMEVKIMAGKKNRQGMATNWRDDHEA